MPKICKVCEHFKRLEIENDLYTGGSNNTLVEVGKRYGVTASQLKYHKDNHMATAVDEAKLILDEKSKEAGVNRILEDVKKLDKIIARLDDPEVLAQVTPKDAITAMKVKAELLGDIKEEGKKVEIEWIDQIPKEDK